MSGKSLLDPNKVYKSWHHIELAENIALLERSMAYAKEWNQYAKWAQFIRVRQENITYWLKRIEQRSKSNG